MTQERVTQFADVTEDHYYIHGWSAEAIAECGTETMAQAQQPYGLKLPELELS